MKNKWLSIAMVAICIILAAVSWQIIENLATKYTGATRVIEVLSWQVKQDSIKAESLRFKADSLQKVALEYEQLAKVEHNAKIELIKQHRSAQIERVMAATAQEALEEFISVVDTGSTDIPELVTIKATGDTVAPISYRHFKSANVLFVELGSTREAIIEHRNFEDDLIMVINDINESANLYKSEAETWKLATKDLKNINEGMLQQRKVEQKQMKKATFFNKLLMGALTAAAVKIIFF